MPKVNAKFTGLPKMNAPSIKFNGSLKYAFEHHVSWLVAGIVLDACWLLVAQKYGFDKYSGRVGIIPLLIAAHWLAKKEEFAFFTIGWYIAVVLHMPPISTVIAAAK